MLHRQLTLCLRVLRILQDLVDEQPCVGILFELSGVSRAEGSAELWGSYLVERGLRLFLLQEAMVS
jgi:hypothetical protein